MKQTIMQLGFVLHPREKNLSKMGILEARFGHGKDRLAGNAQDAIAPAYGNQAPMTV